MSTTTPNKKPGRTAGLIFLWVAMGVFFVNHLLFFNDMNPFYEFWAFMAFLASGLGTCILQLTFSPTIAYLLARRKSAGHCYLYYFGLLALGFSLFTIWASYSNPF